MYLPRRLRAAFDPDGEDPETFRESLLDVLTRDVEVQTAIRRLTATPKKPEPRTARRR